MRREQRAVRSDRPVTLHVGTAKSGTTSVQNILARNRKELLRHGFLYPGERVGHFLEALDLRDAGFRGHTFEASEGAWDGVVGQVLAHDGPALLSHEVLAGSTRKVIRRAVKSLAGRPVRVVVTCRDLGRQLPAIWQEGVKNGDTVTYDAFLGTNLGGWEGPASSAGMWRAQNLPEMGKRWGSVVGPENVTFVVVPPPGSPHDVLWHRFCQAVEIPAADYVIPDKARNPSLGTIETELLRRVVEHLPDDLEWPTYARQVKRRLAQRRLVKHRAGGTLTVPEEHRAATERIAGEIIEALESGAYHVVGDLVDLRPRFADGTSPDAVTADQLLERALEVLVPLVLEDGRQPRSG